MLGGSYLSVRRRKLTDKEKELLMHEVTRIVVRTYLKRQSFVFNSHHADDLFQTVFLALWRSYINGKIDWDDNYHQWLQIRAKGAILDHLRSYIPSGYSRYTKDDAPTTHKIIIRERTGEPVGEVFLKEDNRFQEIDDMDTFEKLISILPPKLKTIMRLRIAKGQTGLYVGSLFQKSESWVHYQLKEAIEILQRHWVKQDESEEIRKSA